MRYAVIGKSLPHTLSPSLHNSLGNLSYGVREFETEEALAKFVKSHECKGYNVTIPYKQTVIPLLDFVDEAAKIGHRRRRVRFQDRGHRGARQKRAYSR